MRPTISSAALAVVLGLLSVAMGHGDEDMDMGSKDPKPDPSSYPPTYFALPDHAGVMYAHIGVMVISWIFILPTG